VGIWPSMSGRRTPDRVVRRPSRNRGIIFGAMPSIPGQSQFRFVLHREARSVDIDEATPVVSELAVVDGLTMTLAPHELESFQGPLDKTLLGRLVRELRSPEVSARRIIALAQLGHE